MLQSYSNQNSMVWQKNWYIDQWNGIKSPEINPCTYGQFIYDKEGKNIQWRQESLFNKWCSESCTTTCNTMRLEHSLTSYTKINSKWFKDLTIRHNTKKLPEDNIGRTCFDINHSNIFLDQSLKTKEIKTKINKWKLMKLKSTGKETIDKMKRWHMEWEKIFSNDVTDKRSIPKIYK